MEANAKLALLVGAYELAAALAAQHLQECFFGKGLVIAEQIEQGIIHIL